MKNDQEGAADAMRSAAVDGRLEVGRRLKELRRERDMTLAEVADATGLSGSFLSMVEQGKSDISMGRLTRLAALFGASVADFATSARDPITTRAGHARSVVSSDEGLRVELFTPVGELVMMPYKTEFSPGGGTIEMASHRGEEFFYVLEGEITLELEGIGESTYHAGDSVYFHSETPHRFRNSGDQPAHIVGAVSPPSL
jgi:quercetin dioxygenase-like cupin family protein/DNA-binding XRE family transcriptional regulator